MSNELMPIKMIISDIDGTLLDNQGRLSSITKASIERFQKQGGIFVLATSRHLDNCKSIIDELFDEKSYVISSDGLYIFDSSYKQIKEFQSLTINDLENVLKCFPKCTIVAITNGVDYCVKWKSCLREALIFFYLLFNKRNYQQRCCVKFDKLKRKKNNIRIEKIIVDGEKISQGLSLLRNKYHIIQSGSYRIELLHHCTDKANAAKFLTNMLNLSEEQVAVFGDGQNDKKILKEFSFSYAMSHADSSIKKHSKYIVSSENNNDIGTVINQILGDEKNGI